MDLLSSSALATVVVGGLTPPVPETSGEEIAMTRRRRGPATERERWWLLVAGTILIGALGLWGVAAHCSRRAHEYAVQGRQRLALTQARVAAQLWPSTSHRLDLAEVLLCQTDADAYCEGETILRAQAARNKRLPVKAYSLLAIVAARRGEYEAATSILRDRLATYPLSPDLWYAQAQVMTAQKNWEAALAAYDRALIGTRSVATARGQLHNLHLCRVAAANALGDWHRAMAVAQEAALAFPEEVSWSAYYAEFAEHAGELELAARTRERSVEASGGAPNLAYSACQLLGRMGQPSRGEVLLKRTTLSPFQRHYCLAALYCFTSPKRAVQELLDAQSRAETELDCQKTRLLLAASYTWVGQPAKSLAELAKVRGSSAVSMYARLYTFQAQVVVDRGKSRPAVAAYLQALRDQGFGHSAWECEQILSPRGLRMPRLLRPGEATSGIQPDGAPR